MGWIVFAVVVGVLVYISMQKGSKGKPTNSNLQGSPHTSDPTERLCIADHSLNQDMAYLQAKWSIADQERSAGLPSTFPSWFFDAATDRQLKRITEDGVKLNGIPLTKGRASDVIGLLEPLDEHHAEILKFFKVPVKGMNQTKGRYETQRLLADASNLSAWNERPASAMQKEFFKFHGLPVPKALTSAAAKTLSDEYLKSLPDDDTGNLSDWEYFESIVEQLADKDTREDYNLKKPSMPAIRAAIDALRASGKSLEELDADLELVADKLIETSPDLER